MITLKLKPSWGDKLKASNLSTNTVDSWSFISEKLKAKLVAITDDDLSAWSAIKRKFKTQFSNLDDDDLYLIEGKEDELLSRLKKKIADKHALLNLLKHL